MVSKHLAAWFVFERESLGTKFSFSIPQRCSSVAFENSVRMSSRHQPKAEFTLVLVEGWVLLSSLSSPFSPMANV